MFIHMNLVFLAVLVGRNAIILTTTERSSSLFFRLLNRSLYMHFLLVTLCVCSCHKEHSLLRFLLSHSCLAVPPCVFSCITNFCVPMQWVPCLRYTLRSLKSSLYVNPCVSSYISPFVPYHVPCLFTRAVHRYRYEFLAGPALVLFHATLRSRKRKPSLPRSVGAREPEVDYFAGGWRTLGYVK